MNAGEGKVNQFNVDRISDNKATEYSRPPLYVLNWSKKGST